MFFEITNEIIKVKEKVRECEKLQGMLKDAKKNLERESVRLEDLKIELDREALDVKKLEGLTIHALFHTILRDKEDQLQKERQELLLAKLKYDECANSVASLKEVILKYESSLAECSHSQSEYEALVEEKKKLIFNVNDKTKLQLISITEDLAALQSNIKELEEAISAGNAVYSKLQDIISSLESAENWGTWDMFGGGLLATASKHSKIDEANDHAFIAQNLINKFEAELKDVSIGSDLTLNVGSFSTFADYFFDGLISDWVVQSQIEESLQNVINVANNVKVIINRLSSSLITTKEKAKAKREELNSFIESV
ncbi:hypothetical protein J2Z44_002616 [Clostridium punense]|uniref:Uncharacterized protein n=1 Tax=Clostridium punense TaxID=1054297 RepID=A0ABS4K4S7_9CLOT|nr:hypothetical protein [Clostridium punense]MBP2022793.1 hypothetical protein [Clostridium punense]